MARTNKIIEASMAPIPERDEDIPEWAKPSSEEPAATADPIEAEIPAPTNTPALDNLLAWLINEASDGDSLKSLESIVRETLTAQDAAAVLRQKLPTSASDFVGVAMLLEDFRITASDYEEGSVLPFYASLYVQVGNPPEPRVINAGSVKILAQLKRFRELDHWPQVIKIVEAGKAKKGQSAPLALAPVE